ncbi:hypothetical protein [Thioalkalivibrio sp. ALgr3]|uniref:hypothetical protein n=1 Tax=Thioalkalivibrio sp. ALgr3 TaxID=1239292 RepID=UPI0018CA97E6|nr:hypothetical protein [Thioalkalivibrio sp. ALgr3]
MSQPLKSAIYATIFFFLSVLAFGANDWFSLSILAASIVFLYPTILIGQMTLRNVSKTAVQQESILYAFLNQPKTIGQQLFSGGIAVILGVSFLTVAKGIEINHGLIPVVVFVFLLTWWVSGRLASHPDLSKLERRYLRPEATTASVAKEADKYNPESNLDVSFLSLIAAIIVINIIFALLLSAKDLFTFFVADVDFSNFRSYALERGVPSGEFNSVSRVFINLYVMFDSFKLAAANEMLMAFGVSKSESHSAYYIFYLFVLVLNALKLLAFSVPLVFLQRGLLSRGAALFEAPASRVYKWLAPYFFTPLRFLCNLVEPVWRAIKAFFSVDNERSQGEEGTGHMPEGQEEPDEPHESTQSKDSKNDVGEDRR